MILCPQCPNWTADKHDNGVGTCTGMVGVVEVNAGAYGLDVVEFLTPAWFGCVIPERNKDAPAHTKNSS